MSWMNAIVSWLKSCESYFYNAYSEVYGWVYPFWLLSHPLLYVSRAFGWLAYYFSLFNNWLVWAGGEITKILNWDTIRSYILSWFRYLGNLGDLFYYFGQNVLSVVNTWWQSRLQDIQDLINIATQGFAALKVAWDNFWKVTWPQWTTKLDTVKANWDNFWSFTFPTLVSFTWLTIWWNSKLKDVDKLTTDKLKEWFPFYNDLIKLWDGIKLFFTDPEEWLYKAADRIIERFW